MEYLTSLPSHALFNMAIAHMTTILFNAHIANKRSQDNIEQVFKTPALIY